MKAIAGVLILAGLVFVSGCSRSDWIERTLVTVDVTGTWYGSVRGGGRTWGQQSLVRAGATGINGKGVYEK